MVTRKLTLITTPIILLLFSLTTACQAAAPPAIPGGVIDPVSDTPSQQAQDDGDTADLLPELQQPVEADAPAVQNTGEEDNDDEAGSSPQFAQGTDTSDQNDDDDDGDSEDGDDFDDDDDDESLLENKQHPVANALVEEFNVSYEEIVALHQAGYGFGEIAKAFSLADELGMAPEEILPQATEMGWGELLKTNGLHPSLAGKGNNLGAIMSKQKGKGNPPAHAGPPGGDGPPGRTKKDK